MENCIQFLSVFQLHFNHLSLNFILKEKLLQFFVYSCLVSRCLPSSGAIFWVGAKPSSPLYRSGGRDPIPPYIFDVPLHEAIGVKIVEQFASFKI